MQWGNPLGAALLMVTFSLVGTGAGMLIGTTFSNAEQAAGLSVFFSLLLAALGGAMVPLEIFPDTMRQIAHVTPHAWAIDGYSRADSPEWNGRRTSSANSVCCSPWGRRSWPCPPGSSAGCSLARAPLVEGLANPRLGLLCHLIGVALRAGDRITKADPHLGAIWHREQVVDQQPP